MEFGEECLWLGDPHSTASDELEGVVEGGWIEGEGCGRLASAWHETIAAHLSCRRSRAGETEVEGNVLLPRVALFSLTDEERPLLILRDSGLPRISDLGLCWCFGGSAAMRIPSERPSKS